MSRRKVLIAAGAAVLLLAGAVGAVRVTQGCTPLVDCGVESGYSPPQTMVLVSADGLTLQAGFFGCVDYAALRAVERPDSVLLRVYWRVRRTSSCLADDMPALSLNYQVQLSAPLAGRRLIGPDGAALPWLGEASMLRFTAAERSGMLRFSGPAKPGKLRLSGRGHRYPLSASTPAQVLGDPLFPATAVKCLGIETETIPTQLRLDQCAAAGAKPAAPTPGPAAGAGSGHALSGVPVTVRGRAGHVVDGAPGTPWAGYVFPWRALWWVQGNRIVVLISQRPGPTEPPLLSAAQLVAVADELSCLQPAACR